MPGKRRRRRGERERSRRRRLHVCCLLPKKNAEGRLIGMSLPRLEAHYQSSERQSEQKQKLIHKNLSTGRKRRNRKLFFLSFTLVINFHLSFYGIFEVKSFFFSSPLRALAFSMPKSSNICSRRNCKKKSFSPKADREPCLALSEKFSFRPKILTIGRSARRKIFVNTSPGRCHRFRNAASVRLIAASWIADKSVCLSSTSAASRALFFFWAKSWCLNLFIWIWSNFQMRFNYHIMPRSRVEAREQFLCHDVSLRSQLISALSCLFRYWKRNIAGMIVLELISRVLERSLALCWRKPREPTGCEMKTLKASITGLIACRAQDEESPNVKPQPRRH